MLRITLGGEEMWDDEDEVFVYSPTYTVKLEHSLAALSKWEARFEKPFLTEDEKSNEEVLFYVECMMIDVEDTASVLAQFTQDHINEVQRYIDAKQTATWFSDNGRRTRSTQVVTNELLYYWMSVAGIDISWEDRHLNRLMTLLRVHSAQSEHAANGGKPKKMTGDDAARRMAENKRRREMYGSKG